MSSHSEFLIALEYARSIEQRMEAQQWRGCCDQFLQRRWIINDGHLTTLMVSVLGSEEEVDIEVDEAAGTFSYRSPGMKARTVTRALSDIAIYVANLDAWFDELIDMFEIENSRRARKRCVIPDQLWHLGDLRVPRSHQFAPLYVARQVDRRGHDLNRALLDPIRPGQGIVMTALESSLDLPNGHQAVELDRLLVNGGTGLQCDVELLTRLLRGVSADVEDRDEYFDERAGELKLGHMEKSKNFVGKQKKVIALFWKERHQSARKWSEVIALTDCGKDPDSVFGKGVWSQWLERIDGRYHLRTRRTV